MAHTLTQQELSRLREAFANWDTTGDGTIRWRDMYRVMEEAGEGPSPEFRRLCDRPGCEEERVYFYEFLNITVGPPWEATGQNEEEILTEAMADFDDGDGYVPLPDLMRIVHKHMEESGYNLADGDLVDVYRQALDGSLLETLGEGMAPGVIRKVLQDEFAALDRGPKTEQVDARFVGQSSPFLTSSTRKFYELLARVHRGLGGCSRRHRSQLGRHDVDADTVRHQAGDDGEPTVETARMMNLTVVDLGGNQLMVDAVASTWTVRALQQHIETVLGMPVHRQYLSLAGDDELDHGLSPDDVPLSEAGLVDGSTLVLASKGDFKVDYQRFITKFMEMEFGP